jgi:hypothetical protein
MLDEDEYATVANVYKDAIKGTKEFRQRGGVSLENVSIDECFKPVRILYERLTGMKNCHQNAIAPQDFALRASVQTMSKTITNPPSQIFGGCMYPVQKS